MKSDLEETMEGEGEEEGGKEGEGGEQNILELSQVSFHFRCFHFVFPFLFSFCFLLL